MDNTERQYLERQNYLAGLVVDKWFQENQGRGLHLEQYNGNALYPMMASHMRKLLSDENFVPPEHMRTEVLDEIFQTILKSGLVSPVSKKVVSKEERKAAELEAQREAEDEQFQFDLAVQKHVWGLEKAGGQKLVSEFYHKFATKEQKAAFDRLCPSGAIVPESAPQQAANLFIVKATSRDGKTKFISSDGFAGGQVVLDGERSNAFQFGASRANRFSELLKQQRPELDVQIVPLTQTERGPELSDEKLNEYARNLHCEIWERENLPKPQPRRERDYIQEALDRQKLRTY